jgi:energy-coupling factor transport system ATP-binding protein
MNGGARLIHFNNVSFSYTYPNQDPIIHQITLTIESGEFVAIVGPNGSGKSTLAKLMNGLLLPTEGDISIGVLNTRREDELMEVRQKVGMVFQNPENQMVATTVLDDVAFGLENIGYPSDKMMARIEESLQRVNMWQYQSSEPHHLSGGQKQRVAIAGVLAMKPGVILFDESTSMLDPEGRAEMLDIMKDLHNEGLTVITITHDMGEASQASRLIMLKEGRILRDGTPNQIFEEAAVIKENQLELPFMIEAREALIQHGLSIPPSIQTKEELVKHLWTLS